MFSRLNQISMTKKEQLLFHSILDSSDRTNSEFSSWERKIKWIIWSIRYDFHDWIQSTWLLCLVVCCSPTSFPFGSIKNSIIFLFSLNVFTHSHYFYSGKKIQNSLSDLRIISYPTMDKNNIIQRIIQVQKKKKKREPKDQWKEWILNYMYKHCLHYHYTFNNF